MKKYVYDGPVEVFGRCVANHWKGITLAESEAKARSNLAYQYKIQNGKIGRTKVTLPGKIRMVEQMEE